MNKHTDKKGLSFINFYNKYGIFLIIIILFITCSLVNSNFIKTSNLMNVLKQITVVAIIACGETMLICAGMIDLSAGQLAGTSGCCAAAVLVMTGNVSIAFLSAILCGVLFSYSSGILVTVFELPPFIATLAISNIAEGITYLYTGASAITGVDKLRWLGQGRIFDLIPVMVLFMIGAIFLIHIILRYTRFGLTVYAIGGNENATRAAGINVERNKRLIFVLSGALCGLAGVILTARMMAGQPNVGSGYEFDAITATIVGGTSFTGGVGGMMCVFAGAIIIGLLNNILNLMNVSKYWQLIVKGVLIAFAVILDIKTKKIRK